MLARVVRRRALRRGHAANNAGIRPAGRRTIPWRREPLGREASIASHHALSSLLDTPGEVTFHQPQRVGRLRAWGGPRALDESVGGAHQRWASVAVVAVDSATRANGAARARYAPAVVAPAAGAVRSLRQGTDRQHHPRGSLHPELRAFCRSGQPPRLGQCRQRQRQRQQQRQQCGADPPTVVCRQSMIPRPRTAAPRTPHRAGRAPEKSMFNRMHWSGVGLHSTVGETSSRSSTGSGTFNIHDTCTSTVV